MRAKFSEWTKPSDFAGLILATTVSITFVVVTFGIDFVLGTSSYWQTQVDDVTQYIAGFNMYFVAPWQLPLLAFDSLNYPHGTRVTFADAIPLYALALKLLLPLSWAPFNPFGLWVAICFTLQGVSAWWISRLVKTNSWLFLIALLAILLSYPALMARLGHISLMSHWILLFSIAMYIRDRQLARVAHWGWTFFLVAAFYVNIYLFTMACGIFLASFLSSPRCANSRDLVYFFTPFFALAATSLLTLLPLPTSDVTREWGFGYYSMNLLAPLMGGTLFAIQANEVPGQYEGFNYLGLGVLAALVAAHTLSKRSRISLLKNHRALVLTFTLYTIYAISNQIYFGDQKILELRYPAILDPITSQFRASGRFFWPVGYGLAIWALLILHRNLEKPKFFAVAILIVGLQLADLQDRYEIMRTTAARGSLQPLDYSLWDENAVNKAEVVYFYPQFKCGGEPHTTLLPVMRYAAERGLKLNTGYIARYTPNCQTVAQEIAASKFENSAYVFARTEYPSLDDVKPFFQDKDGVRCTEIQFAYVCMSSETRGR